MQRVPEFPNRYSEAVERFQQFADASCCTRQTWTLPGQGPCGETLSIDIARWGQATATRWLILTSGLHGTEAPFGSAVQFRLLDDLARREPPCDIGVLMLHALNPFGYAWVRRANEDNVDLNRNFLLPGEAYQGSPPLYKHVYEAFNPHRRRRFYHSFYAEAWWLIRRHGMAALQSNLPVGQYEYPEGLFYGGAKPAQLLELLQEHVPRLLPRAQAVTHLDFHTGLGRWGDYRLLLDGPYDQVAADWFRTWQPRDKVEAASANKTAYNARGSFGPWMKAVIFPHADYHYAAAEFGTYRAVRVLRSLVKELQVHYALPPEHRAYQWAKRLVQATFVPPSPAWRRQVLSSAHSLCQMALKQLHANEAPHSEREVSSVPARAC
jgi:hypothetical protein